MAVGPIRRNWARSTASAATALAGCVAFSTGAAAGPWTVPKGEIRAYLSAEISRSDARTDALGAADHGERRTATGSVTVESGVTDWATLGGTSEIKWARLESDDGATGERWGVTDSGGYLRLRLWRDDVSVFSLQTGVILNAEPYPDHPMALGDGATSYEMRGLYGRGLATGFGAGWIAGEAAYRLREGDAADQIRLDAVAGVRPNAAPRAMAIVNVFSTWSTERDGGSDYDVVKLRPSVAYELTDAVTVQIGVQQEIYARDIERATTGALSLWIRY